MKAIIEPARNSGIRMKYNWAIVEGLERIKTQIARENNELRARLLAGRKSILRGSEVAVLFWKAKQRIGMKNSDFAEKEDCAHGIFVEDRAVGIFVRGIGEGWRSCVGWRHESDRRDALARDEARRPFGDL